MPKTKYNIGYIVNDFKLIDIIKQPNNKIKYKIQCLKCNDIRDVYNLTKKQTTHSIANCKNTYVKSFIGNTYNDFKCIDSYMNKRLFLVLKCQVCGIEREVAKKDLKRFSNKHGYTCIKTIQNIIDDFDNIIYKRLLTKYKNIKYRISNPKYHAYEKYKNLGCEYQNSCDFILDLYDEYKIACQKFGIDNVFIDRIDNDKGYFYENIRFTNAEGSVLNRDIQTYFLVDNKLYMSATAFAKDYNVSHGYISRELRKININDTFNFRGHIIKKIK